MGNQEIIVRGFLNSAGFVEKGINQFHKNEVGIIFIREYDSQKVLFQILELGEKHHANRLRNLLFFKDQVETYEFNPQV